MSKTIPFRQAGFADDAARPALATDPILVAIERHKLAFCLRLMTNRVRCLMIETEGAEGYDAVECKNNLEADDAAIGLADHAADALTTVKPTTMAGVLALVRHFDAFNTGAFFLEPADPDETVNDWRSGPTFWPGTMDGDYVGFSHRLLANVGRALEALAVRS